MDKQEKIYLTNIIRCVFLAIIFLVGIKLNVIHSVSYIHTLFSFAIFVVIIFFIEYNINKFIYYKKGETDNERNND